MNTFIQANLEEPLLFRTGNDTVHQSAIQKGELWLRTAHHYSKNELNQNRQDDNEGVNYSNHNFELRFNPSYSKINSISGDGSIGCILSNCYLLCLHSTSIREDIRKDFGGRTFGIKSLYPLVNDILYQASQQLKVVAHRYGQVSYQYTPLMLSSNPTSASIELGKGISLKTIGNDILRKAPVEPYIGQDEWRIAVFVDHYLSDDPNSILKLKVNPNHFYDYPIG